MFKLCLPNGCVFRMLSSLYSNISSYFTCTCCAVWSFNFFVSLLSVANTRCQNGLARHTGTASFTPCPEKGSTVFWPWVWKRIVEIKKKTVLKMTAVGLDAPWETTTSLLHRSCNDSVIQLISLRSTLLPWRCLRSSRSVMHVLYTLSCSILHTL